MSQDAHGREQIEAAKTEIERLVVGGKHALGGYQEDGSSEVRIKSLEAMVAGQQTRRKRLREAQPMSDSSNMEFAPAVNAVQKRGPSVDRSMRTEESNCLQTRIMPGSTLGTVNENPRAHQWKPRSLACRLMRRHD